MQTLTRKFEFDAGHRVMNERMKCFNAHGHRYVAELEFEFADMEEIGYAIDFKEIKRVGAQYLDDMMDHGFLLNPQDGYLMQTLMNIDTKIWEMSLAGPEGYCNPTAENISREILLIMELLFEEYEGLQVKSIKLYETPNCWVTVVSDDIPAKERVHFLNARMEEIKAYANAKGILDYDDRTSTEVNEEDVPGSSSYTFDVEANGGDISIQNSPEE